MTLSGSTASPRPCSCSWPAPDADAIAFLLAVREPADRPTGFAGLPGISLPGLAAPQARQLLSAVGDLDDGVATRIVAQTRGNPLALIEMGLELTPGQLAGVAPLPELLPLGRRLEARFLWQTC